MIVDIWKRGAAGPAHTEFRRRSVAGSAPVYADFRWLCRSDFTIVHLYCIYGRRAIFQQWNG